MSRLHFLFGVAPRSGTTYLGDLLALHPDCSQPVGLPEDGLLGAIGHLDSFSAQLVEFWRSWPELGVPTSPEVMEAIGSGLREMVTARAETTSGRNLVLSKTPFPTNLNRLRDLFPESKAIVIVRDGRAVVESTVRTWGSPFDVASARFRDGARSILGATGGIDAAPEHLHVLTYESLFDDPLSVAGEALRFLGLDPSLLPADSVVNSPVRGSSTSRGDEGVVHWDAMDRPENFQPKSRWHSWSDSQHQLFAAIAGEENRSLGYEAEEVGATMRRKANVLAARRFLHGALPERAASGLERLRDKS